MNGTKHTNKCTVIDRHVWTGNENDNYIFFIHFLFSVAVALIINIQIVPNELIPIEDPIPDTRQAAKKQ